MTPTGLSATLNPTQTNIHLIWDDDGIDDGNYIVGRAVDNTNTWTVYATLPYSSTSFDDGDVQEGKTYYYGLWRTNDLRWSYMPSNIVSVHITPCPGCKDFVSAFWVPSSTTPDQSVCDTALGYVYGHIHHIKSGINCGLPFYEEGDDADECITTTTERTITGPCNSSTIVRINVNLPSCPIQSSMPVNLYDGAKSESATDLTIPGRGMDFTFSRNYSSREGRRTLLGYSWDSNWSRRLCMPDNDSDLLVNALDSTPNTPNSWINASDYDGDLVPYWADSNDNSAKFPRTSIYPYWHPYWANNNVFALLLTLQPVNSSRLPGSVNQDATIYLYDGGGSGLAFFSNTPGGTYVSPIGVTDHLSVNSWNTANTTCTVTLRRSSGDVDTYYGFHNPPRLTDGHLASTRDAQGNTIALHYDDLGRISYFTETLGRSITLTYWDDRSTSASEKANLLKQIQDPDGRQVQYDYDSEGNLTKVNVFGREARYEYSQSSSYPGQPDLAHNLIKYFSPREVAANPSAPKPFKVITYGTTGTSRDRVVSETIGETDTGGTRLCGGTETYSYVLYKDFDNTDLSYFLSATDYNRGRFKTRHTKTDGSWTDYYFNGVGLNVLTVRGGTGVDPLIAQSSFDGEGRKLASTSESGIQGTSTFLNINEADYLGLGRLFVDKVTSTTMAGCGSCGTGGSASGLVEWFTYEALRGAVRTHTDSLGNVTRYYFDYQEDTSTNNVLTALAKQLFVTDSPTQAQTTAVQNLLTKLGVELGLGDINGDGVTNQYCGNVVRVDQPTVNLATGSNQAVLTGSTVQKRVQIKAYNASGLLSYDIDEEGNKTTYAYDSSGRLTQKVADVSYSSFTSAGSNSSYTYAVNPSNRNSGQTASSFAGAKETYDYDSRGNRIHAWNPRGVRTDFAYNNWDELTTTTAAAALDTNYGQSPSEPSQLFTLQSFGYRTTRIYDANGQLTEDWTEDPAQMTAAGRWIKVKYEYNILGQRTKMTQEADANDRTKDRITSYYYDPQGRQALVVYPEGNADYTEYDKLGRAVKTVRGITSLSGITSDLLVNPPDASHFGDHGGLPLVTSNAYDATTGYLDHATVGDSSGLSLSTYYRYNDKGLKRMQIEPSGAWTELTYDAYDRVSDEQRYGKINDQASTVTLMGHTNYVYDAIGRQIQVNQKVFLPSGVSTQRSISLSGGTLGGKPSGEWIGQQREYDRLGRVTFEVDDRQKVAKHRYDGMGRQFYTEDPQGNKTENWYDAAGNTVETKRTDKSTVTGTNDEVFRNTFFYDALGRLQVQVDNLGRATDCRYNSRGMTAAVSEGNDLTGRHCYRRGDTSSYIDVGRYGRVTLFDYDALGQKIKETKLMGYDYSNMGRDLDGGAVSYGYLDTSQGGGDGKIETGNGYDKNGNLETLTDDNGNQTVWEYDSVNRKVSETKGHTVSPYLADQAATPTSIIWVSYGTCGNLEQMVKEDATVMDYTYDAAGRMIQIDASDVGQAGATRQTFTYDWLGRRIKATDNNDPSTVVDDSEVTWAYDSLGRVVEESSKIGTGSVRYTSSNFASAPRSRLVYPGSSGRLVDFTYNDAGALATVKDNGAGSNIASYDYIGSRMLKRTMQNGVNLDYTNGSGTRYDGLGRPTRIEHKNGGGTVAGEDLAYSPIGDVTSQVSLRDTLSDYQYAYDYAGRLTGASPQRTRSTVRAGMPYSSSWGMDGVGNWNAHNNNLNQGGSQTENYSFLDNSFNQYYRVNSTTCTLTYDANGNLASNPLRGQTYAWDAFNRLVTVSSGGTAIAHYIYDADGRRIRKNYGSGLAQSAEYLYDGWRAIEEREGGSANPARQFVYGIYLDEPLVMDVNGNANGSCIDFGSGDSRYFYHQNLNYSVVGLTNASGVLVEAYEYGPYGRHITFSHGGGAVLFNGTDTMTPGSASTLGNPFLYTGQRFDSETGMYYYKHRYYDTQAGRFISRDPIGYANDLNDYQYVFSEPINQIDSYGLLDYRIGDYDLKINTDTGSGTHGSKAPATVAQRAARLGWYAVAAGANALGYYDASKNMRHFLDNTGSDLTINYSGLISKVPNAQNARDMEINEALKYAESVNDMATFTISSHAASSGYCRKLESENWYYAVGGYSTWGKAKVVAHDKCKYEMTFDLKFFDKYNWDVGKSVTIFGIRVPDIALGELHQAGIAQEYLMNGNVTYKIEWTKGQRIGNGAKVEEGSR